jgi:hypothetical protein
MLLAHCHPWKVPQVSVEFKSIDLTECPWIEQQQHRRSESRVLVRMRITAGLQEASRGAYAAPLLHMV